MKLDARVYQGRAAMLRDTTAGYGPGLSRHHAAHEADESQCPFTPLPLGSFSLIPIASLCGGGCLAADTSLSMPPEAG